MKDRRRNAQNGLRETAAINDMLVDTWNQRESRINLLATATYSVMAGDGQLLRLTLAAMETSCSVNLQFDSEYRKSAN